MVLRRHWLGEHAVKEYPSRAGFPGSAHHEVFAKSIDSLRVKIMILATFLLNFRSFVDNRIDFYGKTL